MSKVICVMGESGSGKTTSMRNLDYKSTYYIDCDKKGLSWRGWRNNYNSENKNYYLTDDVKKVSELLVNINNKAKHIKVVVIDTLNALMIADEMKRSKEKGYDKWLDLAVSVWDLVCLSHTLREDLTVIFTAHSQTERDEFGYNFTKIKTSGKKIDKICLESKFTTVLLATKKENRYVFETTANNSTAKTPFGAFENEEIDNDILEVIKVLEEY